VNLVKIDGNLRIVNPKLYFLSASLKEIDCVSLDLNKREEKVGKRNASRLDEHRKKFQTSAKLLVRTGLFKFEDWFMKIARRPELMKLLTSNGNRS
jgi:hypothetical protein